MWSFSASVAELMSTEHALSPMIKPCVTTCLLPRVFMLVVIPPCEGPFGFTISVSTTFMSSITYTQIESFGPGALYLPPVSMD